MAKEHILVVEDEEDIRELVVYNLQKEGYNITAVPSGEEALKVARQDLPDLIVLDLMLPGVEGLDVCKILKGDKQTQHIPIIILTAKTEEADIVTGLELGADDYVTKPFSPRILIARTRAALRRKKEEFSNEESLLKIHDLVIHPGRHEVTVNGEHIELTFTEFRILHFLASRSGWVFTRDQILDAVRGGDYIVTDRSVDVQIVGLRRKLKSAGKHIETVRGIGYRFKE